ncbi:Uncharacterised protein [Neisseria animalis]|nr:Uncharacterised protein [Neisseria animalis]
MIQRCFALPYYVYCLRLRCLVSFLFYSTINQKAVCNFADGLFCGYGFGRLIMVCKAADQPSATISICSMLRPKKRSPMVRKRSGMSLT